MCNAVSYFESTVYNRMLLEKNPLLNNSLRCDDPFLASHDASVFFCWFQFVGLIAMVIALLV